MPEVPEGRRAMLVNLASPVNRDYKEKMGSQAGGETRGSLAL